MLVLHKAGRWLFYVCVMSLCNAHSYVCVMLKYVCVIGKFQERDQNVAKIGDSVLYFTRFSILGL